jgi:hypothetical protein
MKTKKILGISLVLLALVGVMSFAQSHKPVDGYYTSKDNGYQILIRLLGGDQYYVQYFGPNGGKILTSQATLSDRTFSLEFTDDAGKKCSIRVIGPKGLRDNVTGGSFLWNRNP